jgi:hypothetical protein
MESALVSWLIAEVPGSRRIVDANTPEERVVAEWGLRMVVAGRMIDLAATRAATLETAADQFAARLSAALDHNHW